MKHPNKFILLIAAAVAFLGGCTGSNPPANPSISATPSTTPISITIPIQADQFSTQAVVYVALLNASQIAIEAANPPCMVMGYGSGAISTQCPPGTVYKDETPEGFTFKIGEIGDQIQVTSTQLKLGEQFRITVGGLSADDCNTRSARFSGVVNAETMVLKDLLWATTQMGCMKTP